MGPRLLVLVASGFLLAAAEAAEPTPVAGSAQDLVASVGSATDGRIITATSAIEAVRLAREATNKGVRRLVLVVPRVVFDAGRPAWNELARDLREQAVSLRVQGVEEDGATSTMTWSGERSPLLAPALAAAPLERDLGTGVPFEPSASAAFARAAREGRLVLLVQLSGRFDAVPET